MMRTSPEFLRRAFHIFRAQPDHIAFREIRCLRYVHIAYFRLGARKLIDIYGVTLVTVDVVSERCENSVQVRRAAGAGEYGDTGRDGIIIPGELTAFKIYFKRIFIEEGFSVKRQSGDHAVVQDSLYYVGVHGIVFKAHHAVSEEHQGNGCTGLGISQVVAQVYAYEKDSPERAAPIPPVTYIFLPTISLKSALQVLYSSLSFVSYAKSAIAEYR